MNAKSKITAEVWRWAGWAVISIRELPQTKHDPCISYPDDKMTHVFKEINACALPIFKTKREAETYKKTCRENFPDQYHRVTQVALTIESVFTEKERRDVSQELRDASNQIKSRRF